MMVERRPVQSGGWEITIVTDRRAVSVGIDPCNKYVDRNSDDNLVPTG